MPPWLTITLGSLLIIVVMIDLIWSILSTLGAGPIATSITSLIWIIARTFRQKTSFKALSKLTPLAMLGTIFMVWLAILWAGWLLIFIAHDGAIIVESTGARPSLFGHIYFVGTALSTLGSSQIIPKNPQWGLIMGLASFNGLIVLTLFITYLLPIVSAAVDRRQIALTIWGLGESSEDIVLNGWNQGSFQVLESQLYQLALQLLTHSERHVAYPVLQYFSAASPRADLSPRIASLDDAITILAHAVPAHLRPAQTVLRTLRKAISEYLRRVEERHIKLTDEPPELPDFGAIRRAQIPLVSDDEIKTIFDERRDHRRLLCGFVEADGWSWRD